MLTMYGIDTSGCYRRTAGSAAPHTPCVRQHSQQHWSTVQFCARDFAAFRERNPSSSLDDRGHHAVPSHPKITLNGDGNLRGWRAGGHSQPQGFIVGAGVGRWVASHVLASAHGRALCQCSPPSAQTQPAAIPTPLLSIARRQKQRTATAQHGSVTRMLKSSRRVMV